MTNYSVSSVDQFIAASPEVSRSHLSKIRSIVSAAIPDAEEKIGYGKPYYKYNGWIAGFDVYTEHIGFEVWDGLSKDEREELEEMGYKTGSVTFKIRYDQEVPIEIIKSLVTKQFQSNLSKPPKKN